MAAAPLTVPRDPTGDTALARLPASAVPLTVSIACHLVALQAAGRVRCPKVAALVEWAKEVAV